MQRPDNLIPSRPTLGIIMPVLSGFYMGEINATLRQLAFENNINLMFIRSGDHPEFDLPVGFQHLDGLIVLLGCASERLVEHALSLNIPVLSMGGHYSLDVEHFFSDQAQGITALYQHLTSLGHRQIGFCGDFTVDDIRQRFSAYKTIQQAYGHAASQAMIFEVNNCSLAGGREAAVLYQQRQSPCSAIICATDHNAIGMIEQLEHMGLKVPQDIAVVGVDNVFLGDHTTPQLTTVDQRLESLTRDVFFRALKRMQGAPYSRISTSLEQQLIVRRSCGVEPREGRKAIDPTLGSPIRQALLTNEGRSSFEIFENFYSLAQEGFSAILDAQSIYNSPLAWACLATGRHGEYHVDSWAEKGMTHPSTLDSQHRISDEIESFPFIQHDTHYIATIIPIATGTQQQWKLVSVVDAISDEVNIHSMAMFNNYLDMLALFIERDALIATSKHNEQQSQQLLEQLEVVSNSSNDGIWEWDIAANHFRLNGRLLAMVGIESSRTSGVYPLEQVIDLAHHEDRDTLKQALKQHLRDQTPFKLEFRLKSSKGEILWVNAAGSALYNAQGRAVKMIGSVTDVTERRVSAEKIRQMAYYDALTGVANRRKIIEIMNSQLAALPTQPKAVMLMDLNRFKFINDTFGHHVGDALLQHVTQQIQSTLAATHRIARLGGDEFLLFCDVANREQALALASDMLDVIKKPLHCEEIELVASGSIGIAMYPWDATTPDDLIKRADIAMYQAKRQGATQPACYRQQDEESLFDKVTMEHHLKLAIENREIVMHYQPLFSPTDNHFTAVEALARWHSPQLGHVAPHQFIRLAEEINLIGALGKHLIHQVCRDIKQSVNLNRYQHVSVNLSAKQLIQPDFAHELISIIHHHHLPVSRFCFEVTETAAITDFDACLQALTTLSQAGAKISLDDFGAGFSSLSLLQKLPIDEIKIDRSFVKDIVFNDNDLNFVSTIVVMARGLGLRVVVEGVETTAHLDKLTKLDVDFLQGYCFAMPSPIEQLSHYVPAQQPAVTKPSALETTQPVD